jgi:uncharacterized protein (TIGR02452 family)
MTPLDLRVAVFQQNLRAFRDEALPRVCSTKYVFRDTRPTVVNGDTLDVTMAMMADGAARAPLVLNMADISRPGGCVLAGGGMQEEMLFRRTDLCRYLPPEMYPIGPDEVVYSRGVAIIRANEAARYEMLRRPWVVSVVSCPGVSMPQLTADGRMLPPDVALLRTKVRAIGHVAARHGHDAIVLGALGCGAFGCPPRHVAEIFREECPRFGIPTTFAILGAVHRTFEEVFAEEPCASP